MEALERFSPATRTWFAGAFPAPTAAQVGAWAAIASGAHALVVAPTGSGKTLAAFLWAIDRLAAAPAPTAARTRVLYISPLKALAVDVERNLRSPLVGITQTAKRLGAPAPDLTVGVRSGDTSSADRRGLVKDPPDILITTPESLYLMLTSAARETLRSVSTVIVDEVHAVAATKRGSHLAVTLERLDRLLTAPAQRIGLSATVRPLAEVARFLGGRAPVQIVAPAAQKRFDLRVVVPVEDMSRPGDEPLGVSLGDSLSVPDTPSEPNMRSATEPREGSAAGAVLGEDDARRNSIWPHVEEAVVDLIVQHNSSIVFANSRRLAERLTARLNEVWAERQELELAPAGAPAGAPAAQLSGQAGTTRGADTLLARAHHGSVSREQRASIEDDLKTGRLRCVVATSSLELGIDMGAVDLVVQVGAPPSVASGLQRVGRAGHQVGEVSRGIVFPSHRADLVQATVAVERMARGQIELLAVPANPLDVLAQQTVAACALDVLDVEEWFESLRRSAPFAALPRSAYEATLDLLAGRYPSEEFAELRPRVVWDRDAGTLTGRPGAQRLAVTSGGTIPDRGLFGVFLLGSDPASSAPGSRVGELDEEMVYESRVGDVFSLGATSWRIHDITHDRVLVTPAFGQPGKVPFWKGDGLGRPAELGAAIGAFLREISGLNAEAATARGTAAGLDRRATRNLLSYLAEQQEATGSLPTDRTLVVERFHDELGDWRLVLHSPYGMPVHAPWALAVGARVLERYGIDGATMAGDDGIVVRIPDTESEPPGADLFSFDPDELDGIVTAEVTGSAIFASRFRECAARALLLPRHNPGRRSPLWQQRQRASQLLDVARKFPTFPIILETVREVLQDVYDLPALRELAKDLAARRIRLLEVSTPTASPFARSLLFSYVGAFMYEGDSPLAERRAAALSLDTALLSDLLGRSELRELLEPDVLERTEAELQRLPADRRARTVEEVADLLRLLGPLTTAEVARRTAVAEASPAETADAAATEAAAGWLHSLLAAKRVLHVSFAGSQWWTAIEDASRLRDALGVPLPIGTPLAFVEPVPDPLADLIGRYARTHGPFTASDAAERFGLGVAVVTDTLRRLGQQRRVVDGEFRPGRQGTEWCDVEVLRRLRNRSLAALRREVEPVDGATYGRFLPAWQHVGGTLRGIDGVVTVIEQLAGVAVPASAWESLLLASRVNDYQPGMLDELTATGEVLWSGAGALPGSDGWVSLHLAETAPLTLPEPTHVDTSALEREVLSTLATGGGFFFRQLSDAVGSTDDLALAAGLWNLVWAGLVSNDTFAPLRALTGSGSASHRTPRARPRAGAYRPRALPRAALPSRAGPPTVAGRWSILPLAEADPTVRAAATAGLLLERYGVVTRGAAAAERVPGGFALLYKTLSAFEDSGRARRGYFIESLGAAQFATSGTVDRLRSFARPPHEDPTARSATVLAATDPANPFGAALPWPNVEGHRPGRKAGALVVLIDGALTLYLERGGRTLLALTNEPGDLTEASAALVATVRRGAVAKLSIERVNGEFAVGSPVGQALAAAGFSAHPSGLRLRA